MTAYTLNEFCDDVRATLALDDNSDGREIVRQKLEILLADADFLNSYVSDNHEHGVEQIYEDEALRFCILAYNMDAPRQSPPHDHGNSWAVYGQAAGRTDMTLWTIDEQGTLRPDREFRLNAGEAGLFDVGAIHSINYDQGAKFVRVTGVDLAQVERRVYDPDTSEVKVIEQVGTGTRSSN